MRLPGSHSYLIIDHRLLFSRFSTLGFPLFSNKRNIKPVAFTITHILNFVLDTSSDQAICLRVRSVLHQVHHIGTKVHLTPLGQREFFIVDLGRTRNFELSI